jgi:hypothetical protein
VSVFVVHWFPLYFPDEECISMLVHLRKAANNATVLLSAGFFLPATCAERSKLGKHPDIPTHLLSRAMASNIAEDYGYTWDVAVRFWFKF